MRSFVQGKAMGVWNEFFAAIDRDEDTVIELVKSGRLALDAAHSEGNILTATANGKDTLTQRLIDIGADVNFPLCQHRRDNCLLIY